jgi:hypothetical protein
MPPPTNPRTKLSVATIHQLDGGAVGLMIDAALRTAIADTEDRGDDGKARKVTVTFAFEQLDSSNVSISVDAKTVVPPYKSGLTIARISSSDNGKFSAEFQPNTPANPDQPTFLDDEIPAEKAGKK